MKNKPLFALWLLGFILLCPTLSAQEINCKVQINSDQIEGTNKQVFNTLKQSIEEFVNNSKWTNLTFSALEKIDCNLLLVVKSVTDNIYTCEATIQASRPVFNTNYTTTLLNAKDDYFNFSYQEYDQLTYQQNSFQTNLTALLAYYVYLILGYDADSYQRLGGTPFYTVCEDIVNVCSTSSMNDTEMKGWSAFTKLDGSRSRYTHTNHLLDEAFKPFRNYFYEYHRLGLDEMSGNVANGRARIAAGLAVLKDAKKARPNTPLVGKFLDAKAEELINIFSGGTADEKTKVYDLLVDIDPTRMSEYDRIKENK